MANIAAFDQDPVLAGGPVTVKTWPDVMCQYNTQVAAALTAFGPQPPPPPMPQIGQQAGGSALPGPGSGHPFRTWAETMSQYSVQVVSAISNPFAPPPQPPPIPGS